MVVQVLPELESVVEAHATGLALKLKGLKELGLSNGIRLAE